MTLVSLVPLVTGDVFGLPTCTTLILAYSKDKGIFIKFTTILNLISCLWTIFSFFETGLQSLFVFKYFILFEKAEE